MSVNVNIVFPRSEAIKRIIKQLSLGCKALFDKEVVHRDLNIKNVLIHYPSMELQGDTLQRYYYEK